MIGNIGGKSGILMPQSGKKGCKSLHLKLQSVCNKSFGIGKHTRYLLPSPIVLSSNPIPTSPIPSIPSIPSILFSRAPGPWTMGTPTTLPRLKCKMYYSAVIWNLIQALRVDTLRACSRYQIAALRKKVSSISHLKTAKRNTNIRNFKFIIYLQLTILKNLKIIQNCSIKDSVAYKIRLLAADSSSSSSNVVVCL